MSKVRCLADYFSTGDFQMMGDYIYDKGGPTQYPTKDNVAQGLSAWLKAKSSHLLDVFKDQLI